MTSRRTNLFALVALVAVIAVPGGASAAPAEGPEAARKLCVRASDDLGFSYVNNLKARNTSCRKAKKVARGYADCRFRTVAKGGCAPLNFNCRETDVTSSPFQRSAHVICKRGGKKVVWDYTQNL